MRKPMSKKAKRWIAVLVILVMLPVGFWFGHWYGSFPQVHKRGADIVTQVDALFETNARFNWHGERVRDAIIRSGRKDIRVEVDEGVGAQGMIDYIDVAKGDLLLSFRPYHGMEDKKAVTVSIKFPDSSLVGVGNVDIMRDKSTFTGDANREGISAPHAKRLANQVVRDVLDTVADNWQDQ